MIDALHAANPFGNRWPARATVELLPGDSAWNPATTKHDLVCGVRDRYLRVQYEQHADGGIHARVLPS